MHELGIIQNIFQILEEVAEDNQLIRITKIKLKLGKMQQIVPEMLTFAFETVAKGTKAEGAVLEVEDIPVKMQCRACHAEFLVEEHIYICPKCAGTNLTMLTGMEVLLDSVEGEQET